MRQWRNVYTYGRMAAVIPANPEPAPNLSAVELAVLAHAAAGRSVTATASAMSYSESYVRLLRSRACEQLAATNIAGAVAAALRHGLIR